MNVAAPGRLQIGRIPVDRVTFDGALARVTGLVEGQRGGIVFTPNVDHVVLASEDARFRAAYAAADVSVADGMPIVWASHALGQPVPEKISGSDLVPRLMALAETKGWRVYLLGGSTRVAAAALLRLGLLHPKLELVGTASPRIDLAEPEGARAAVLDGIRASRPDLVLVCLGAPKQELWIHEVAAALRPAVLLGVGAAVDFLAGTTRRAPRWMSQVGLEWAYRLAREPRRLWRRYLVHDPKFLAILLADLWRRRAIALGGKAEP